MTKPVSAPIPADELVASHLWLVIKLAQDLCGKLPAHVHVEDLIVAGNCGLLTAARNFDPANPTGATFATYARYRIRGAILDALREADWASRGSRRQFKRVELAVEMLGNRLLRVPTEEEIATELGLGVDEYRQIALGLRSECEGALSIIRRVNRSRDGKPMLQDPEAPREDWPDCRRAKTELRTSLNRSCRRLPERWRLIVEMYYGTDLTMKQIGKRLGINESRVSQLHKNALQRLRLVMEEKGITSTAAF